MAYIDYEYYNRQYQGEPVEEVDFPVYEKRASAIIDQLTGYKLRQGPVFNTRPSFLVDQVKEAVATQVEYFQLNGGYDITVTGDDTTGVNIGNFGYGGGNKSTGSSLNGVAKNVVAILLPTGLMHAGVGVMDSAY